MRWLLCVIATAAALVAMVTGCGGAPGYDGRLVAADSLMHDRPDSALALVEAVDADSLPVEADRAYRDLLLTQARYRCYVTATSDSAISRALSYYCCHDGEREKLTRCYIYKGAVMEEMGHPDSAMYYYKYAEATAATDDYFNLGYVKMRMGALYSNYHSLDGMDILKYEEALKLLNKTNDLKYQYICMNNLGCLLRSSRPQEAELLLQNAQDIAIELNDTSNVVECFHALIVLYYSSEQYDKALHLVAEVKEWLHGKPSFALCTTIANLYAKIGLVDSAEYYINICSDYGYQDNSENKLYYLNSLAEIELSRGDTLSFLSLKECSGLISDTLISNSAKPLILKTETDYEKLASKHLRKRNTSIKTVLVLLMVAMFFLAGLLLLWQKFKVNQYNQIMESLKKESAAQQESIKNLQHNFESLKIKDEHLKAFIDTGLGMLRSLTEACYYSNNSKLSKEVKKIITFNEENKAKWVQLYDYIDKQHNNIMKNTYLKYPDINDKELLLLALCCMDYSYIQASIILGYSNKTSVGTMKMRLAKKMRLEGSLDDYINTMAQKK